jgi:hypothetical protein
MTKHDSGDSFRLPHQGAVDAHGTDIVAGAELAEEVRVGIEERTETARFESDAQTAVRVDLQSEPERKRIERIAVEAGRIYIDVRAADRCREIRPYVFTIPQVSTTRL